MSGIRKFQLCYGITEKTCKRLKGNTPFILVYGKEAMVPMEYIVLSLRIVALTKMTDVDAIKQRLTQLVQMKEERFVVGFHKTV